MGCVASKAAVLFSVCWCLSVDPCWLLVLTEEWIVEPAGGQLHRVQ